MKKVGILSALSATLLLTACAVPGEESRPDVYDQSMVNQAAEQRVVSILLVSPAHINANNSQNHTTSTVGGGLVGAGLGAGLGTAFGGGAIGALAGLGGAAIGAGIGSQVERDHAIVDGVIITYDDPRLVGTHSSMQVGRVCEYHPGKALLILTNRNETRIQPNAQCPAKK